MDRKELADEIRAAGFALRYADGPALIFTSVRGKYKTLHSARNKDRASDSEIIRMASTCSACRAVASELDRELAQEWADCYKSFARLIWPCIDHIPDCTSKPYIPVSRKARKSFAKAKARFDAERKARGISEPTKAEKKIAKTLASMAEADRALYEALRAAPAKGIRKKAKTPKKKSARRKKKR